MISPSKNPPWHDPQKKSHGNHPGNHPNSTISALNRSPPQPIPVRRCGCARFHCTTGWQDFTSTRIRPCTAWCPPTTKPKLEPSDLETGLDFRGKKWSNKTWTILNDCIETFWGLNWWICWDPWLMGALFPHSHATPIEICACQGTVHNLPLLCFHLSQTWF